MTPDITELTTEERQHALWEMSQHQLMRTLKRQMYESRPQEIQARLDALTVFILNTLAPSEDIGEEYSPCSPELAELIGPLRYK